MPAIEIPSAIRPGEHACCRTAGPEVAQGDRVVPCRYDHRRLDRATLSEAAVVHHVDVPPELASVGRTGPLAAARVHGPETVRLAGELDAEAADSVARALDDRFAGARRVALADLTFVEVAGLRALRGATGRGLTMAAASGAVRRLVDPAIAVAG